MAPTLYGVRTGGGCRFCAPHGFQLDKPGFVYLVTHPALGAHKVGIAGDATKRLEILSKGGWLLYKRLHFTDGTHAYAVEQEIIRWWREDLLLPPFLAQSDGWTETVDAEALSLPEIWRKVVELAVAPRIL